jgi:hypothetical protein
MSPAVENMLAAAVGAGAVWLYARSTARSTVAQGIMQGIAQIDQSTSAAGSAASRLMGAQAKDAIDREVNAALQAHLGITSTQLRTLVADIRKINAATGGVLG